MTTPGSQKCNLTPKREKPQQIQQIPPHQQEKHNKQQQQQQQQRLLHQYMPLKEIRDYKDLHSPSSQPEREKEPSELSDSSKTLSSQEEEKTAKEDREAKKMRVKQSLMKRARSVAIFSLKLKERRAREGEIKQKEPEKPPPVKWQPPQSGIGGELSCIPIEKLISVDDIAAMEMRKTNH